jgi:hypothetical protein
LEWTYLNFTPGTKINRKDAKSAKKNEVEKEVNPKSLRTQRELWEKKRRKNCGDIAEIFYLFSFLIP